MGVSIEAASVADRDAVIALWHAAGLTRPWNDPARDFDTALSNPTSTILIARDGNDLSGTAMVGFDGHRGWVYYLAVATDQRGSGLGRALMAAAEDWLKAKGCVAIRLMVRGDNEGARGFYSAIGYEQQDVITLGKRLDG